MRGFPQQVQRTDLLWGTRAKKGNRLYRYYMCVTKMKRGKDACPTPSLPAQEIEDFVVDQIRKLARDPELVRQVFEEAVRQQQKLIPKLEKERKRLQRELQAKREEIKRLATNIGFEGNGKSSLASRLAELEDVISKINHRLTEIAAGLESVRNGAVDREDLHRTLGDFNGIWNVLGFQERARIVSLVVDSIECGEDGTIKIAIHDSQPDVPQ